MGHPSSYLLIVPNRGGQGEYFSALRLRDQIEKANPAAKVTILSRIKNVSQEALATINKREGDLTWTVNNEASMYEVEVGIRALNPDMVIEIPYSDTRIQELLQRTLPASTPKFTLGEYSGAGFCLGLGEKEVGVFVDEALLKESKEPKIDHEKALWEALPDPLKTSIQKVDKGKFGFGYAFHPESFIDYIQTVSNLGFKLQKKDELTLVLVGNNACCITPEALGDLGELDISELSLIIHSTSRPKVELHQKGDGTKKLHIVCVQVLEPALFDLCLQSTTDLPVLVTGDDSFIKGLATGAITCYEELEHKRQSYKTFANALREIIPDIDLLTTQVSGDKVISLSPEVKAGLYQKILISPEPWKGAIFNLLNRKKVDAWASVFFTTLTTEKVLECEKDSRLYKAAQVYAYITGASFESIWGLSETPDSFRALLKTSSEEAAIKALWIAAGSDDEDLFLDCEPNVVKLSEPLQFAAYSGAFSFATGTYQMLSSMSFHILPLFLNSPERLSKVTLDVRKDALAYSIKEGNTLVILELMKVERFLPAEELLTILHLGISNLLNQTGYAQDLSLLRLLFSYLSEVNKGAVLNDVLEYFLPNQTLQAEFSRPEYDEAKTLLLNHVIRHANLPSLSKFLSIEGFLPSKAKESSLVEGIESILASSESPRDFILLRQLFLNLNYGTKLEVVSHIYKTFSGDAEIMAELARKEYALLIT